MSSDVDLRFELPTEVDEMLARYRTLLAARKWDWGDDQVQLFRWARFWSNPARGSAALLGDVFAAVEAAGGDWPWPQAVSSIVGPNPPAGVVVVAVTDAGLKIATGPPRPAIAGQTIAIDVVVNSKRDTEAIVELEGQEVSVAGGGAVVLTIDVDGSSATFTVRVDGESVEVADAVRSVAAARLHLNSPDYTRWSVTDASGGGWFPAECPPKWDVRNRPFFHGSELVLDVPAEPLLVTCTRGIEHERVQHEVNPGAGKTIRVECDPQRLFDPHAEGWYGGDLHIHMNYGGDLVCDPHDAARMQLGEGLDLANFVAGNCQTSLVYDAEMLEQFAGRDLPWSSEGTVARVGLEYRNDLLGHLVAFGPDRVPAHLYTGHERSDRPHDRPPNKTVCDELRSLGAAVVYPHPVFNAFPDDESLGAFFSNPRSVEARELVVDAALGAVSAIDVVSPFDDEGAIVLYHHLLSCGLRLAATAGTDAFLSFSHGPGVASNPPGWCRVYAHLGDTQLTADAFKRAIVDGRTVATNGPWLTLTVDGERPGAVLDVSAGRRIEISARARDTAVDQLAVVGAEGAIAQSTARSIDTTLVVEEPTWIAAVARGRGHANVLDVSAIAHTSPVYIDVAGRRVGREADARWCLRVIDELGKHLAEHGKLDAERREQDLAAFGAIIAQARDYYRSVERAAS